MTPSKYVLVPMTIVKLREILYKVFMNIESNGKRCVQRCSLTSFHTTPRRCKSSTMGTCSFLLSLFLYTGAALLLSSCCNASYVRQSDLPHDKWISLDPDIEYLPIYPSSRVLGDANDDKYPDTFYKTSPYVEGESEYDEYQQAWRYLGFMIDCNDGWVAGQDDDGSYDGGTGEGCQRYLLWAAVSTILASPSV